MAILRIQDLTEKSDLATGDLIAIGDSADTYQPKRFDMGNLVDNVINNIDIGDL